MARALIAGAVALMSSIFLAGVPAQAADPAPAGSGGLLSDLLSILRAPPPPAQPVAPAPGAPAASQPAPAPPLTGTLETGSTGALVQALEARLDSLHYFVGLIDQTFDADTEQAVMAFQKVHGLDRTGVVDQPVWKAITTAGDPAPLVASGAPHRVEVDLNRQVLFLYEAGNLSKIVAVSTGNGEDYCENGSCGTATTPTGDFAIYRQAAGWESGPLGDLYNPQYFKGGYALHGSLSVPPQPASHGCVRLPMGAAEWLPSRLSIGTPVHVR